MRAQQALVFGTRALKEAGIDGAGTDARYLLAHALGLSPDRLILVLQDEMPDGAGARFDAAIAARATHRPVAQITGRRLFWGREFRVTQDTLDPRPETEILIEAALSAPFTRVLDLGTGTGCIALTLLAERPEARGLATDLSEAALAVARDNAERLGLSDRIEFRRSDWFAAVGETFDLIVSNPPYIAEDEMAGLAPDVRDWEPHAALTPGGDGLDAYRAIAAGAAAHLAPGGRIGLEIGPTQAEAVCQMLRQGGFPAPEVLRDFDGRDRCIFATLP